VRAQFCIDLATMPIEDASVAWPESESPYIAVARITVPRQDAWSPASVKEIDDGLSFSPWHGLAAHRPLGSVMRARKATYESSARFRASHNNCPRGQDAQQFRASGLNLVIAAIVHWNSTYLVDAIDHMRTQGKAVTAESLARTSPLTWEHIGFSGDFLWDRAAETAGHRRPHNLGRERTAA
jgi:hypothetical protein